ncbi:MAG: V-type ATP synthase subunit A, partial [Candidatus Omnitrophica bacterium]|nr:V-type ATP synthase subunit A [Candidatus Omnitrophota bacterium]
EEPVTQATLKVVGAFHGLSRSRSDARRYPAIDPLISWSKYTSFIDEKKILAGHAILHKSNEVAQMMKVVGEEGVSLLDYIDYLKGEFFDFVYLQQNAFDPIDEATSMERQKYIYDFIYEILNIEFNLENKEKALQFFQKLRQQFHTLNSMGQESQEFLRIEKDIRSLLDQRRLPGKEAVHA